MVKKYNNYGKSYSKVYDLITSHKNYVEEVNSLLSFLRPHLSKKKIVSIGCGTGNHEIIISNVSLNLSFLVNVHNSCVFILKAHIHFTSSCNFYT